MPSTDKTPVLGLSQFLGSDKPSWGEDYNKDMARIASAINPGNGARNWDFRNPVNQREQTVYASVGYTIDRWDITGGSLTVENGRVVYTCAAATTVFRQKVESPASYGGMTLTVAFGAEPLSGARCRAFFSVVVSGITENHYGDWSGDEGVVSDTWVIPDGASALSFGVQVDTAAGSVRLRRAKMEQGGRSTILNDLPADFDEQLIKCQRYYQKSPAITWVERWMQVVTDGTKPNATQFRVPMRIAPTISPITVYKWGGAPLSASAHNISTDGFYVTASELMTAGTLYYMSEWTADAEMY